MDIKMIAIDLDRTLLRTDKTISVYLADVLMRCRERGIKVVFATARPKRTVMGFCKIISTDALILHNGAVTYIADDLMNSYSIAQKPRDYILQALSRDYPEATLSVEIDDTLYANFDVCTVWNYTQAVMTDFTDLPDMPADKIIVGVSSMDDVDQFSKYIPGELYIEMSDGKLGLIMNRNATKWNALCSVAMHFGISAAEIVSFGDDYNDIDMLRKCGIGVAMANAINEVKAVSDYICDTNDNDGVAKWLEENVFSSID